MNEEQIKAFEEQLNILKREISISSLRANELHQSARRAGSHQGYTKVLNKTQYLLKVLEDIRKDYRRSADEHSLLLKQGLDSEKNQNYNYSKINLRNLPIRKNK